MLGVLQLGEGQNIVIAIDGPAGAGKSTVATMVAEKLGLPHLDSGALYRAITLYMLRMGIAAEENSALEAALGGILLEIRQDGISLNGKDVTSLIRTPEIDTNVSPYSALKMVRDSVLDAQRAQGKNGIVADGRDMATVVYPNADVKIFLTATVEERAKRRYEERVEKGENPDYATVLEQVKARDEIDTNRKVSPLRPAEDSVIVDSTGLSAEQIAEKIVALAKATVGR